MSIQRKLTPSETVSPGRIIVSGKEYVDFSSNDYLGLSADPQLCADVSRETMSMGSTGSRLLSGDHPLIHTLEQGVAEWLGQSAALVFNTGYQMNLGVISTLWGASDVIFMDRLVHASMVDGVRLSGARFHRFRHQDYDHLAQLLQKYRSSGQRAVILTESVFSMDGDVSDMAKLVALKTEYDAELYVDEAHAVGVFGPEGSGCVMDQVGIGQVDYVLGTFGKAFGSFGGFLGCSETVKERLVNQCRSFIYSTGLPLPVIQWNVAALARLRGMGGERDFLLKSAQDFRERLCFLGDRVLGESQIVPVVCGETLVVERLSECLKEAGFWVPAIRKPTVAESASRLRFSVTVGHDDSVLEAVQAVLMKEMG